MLYTDGNGFHLTIKTSHLYGSNERMDTAEVLAAIVEEACLYVPTEIFKRSKALTSVELKEKEARTRVETKEARTSVESKEALSIEKVPVAASDLVRIRINEIV